MKGELKALFQDNLFGFGSASISGEGGGYGFGAISEDQALTLLNHAYDLGVKIYDSAPIYGFNLAEKRLGKAFKAKREKVFLVSKSGVSWHENKRVDMTNAPEVTLKMLENSLRNFQSDYIDLYMIHWPDEKVDIRRPLEVLEKAKMQGKIKHIGLCNTTLEDYQLARELSQIEAIQSQFNLFEQGVGADLWELLKVDEVAVMGWGTLDKGIITGTVKEKRKYDKDDCRSWAPWWKAIDKSARLKKMQQIDKVLEAHEVTRVELALQYSLKLLEVDLALCGPRTQEQLEELLKATRANVSISALKEVQQLLGPKE